MIEAEGKKSQSDLNVTGTDYAAPAIESIVTAESLEREVAYAGFSPSQPRAG